MTIVWLALGWIAGVLSTGLALFIWALIMDSRAALSGWPDE